MREGRGIMRAVSMAALAAAALAALAACVTVDKTGAAVKERPTVELTLYEDLEYSASSYDEASELAAGFHIPERAKGRQVKPESLEYFRNSELAKSWLKEGRYRAIAFGHPAKSCPYYNAIWDTSSPQKAILHSLSYCLSYLSRVRNLTGEKCGCRIAGLDDALFGPVEEFEYRSLLPTMLMRAPKGTKDFAVMATGFLEMSGRTGRNQPARLLDGKGDPFCTGTYTSGRPGEGDIFFDCDGEPGHFRGEYRALGLYAGRTYGIVRAQSESAEVIALFGLGEKNFKERWREFAEKMKF